MDGRLRRARVAPVGILLLLMGCAGGEPGGGFSGPGFTFGGPGGDAGDSNDATGSGGTGPDSGVSTGDGSGGVDDGPPPGCTPMPELCNGLDDDCDGTPDNGNPEGGGACSTGLPGICSAGTQTCNLGSLDCVQDMMAAPSDTCGNGLDDDCNGSADDGCLSCYDVDLGTGVPQSVGGSNAGGSDSFTSSCGGGADTIFRFEAPYAGSFTFDTIGSGFDTVLTAYSDCMGSELACNDDFAGNPDCGGYACSEISLALGAGQVVLIAVEGYSGATGAFTLNVS